MEPSSQFSDERACKIFVNSTLDIAGLATLIATLIPNSSIKERTIKSPSFEIHIEKNDDVSWLRSFTPVDGFLYYKFYLEIFPVGEVSEANSVALVRQLLESFWESKCKAVAVCDFDEQLPFRGGFDKY